MDPESDDWDGTARHLLPHRYPLAVHYFHGAGAGDDYSTAAAAAVAAEGMVQDDSCHYYSFVVEDGADAVPGGRHLEPVDTSSWCMRSCTNNILSKA